MIESRRAGYLFAGIEVGLDIGPRAMQALAAAEFGVVLSAYRGPATDAAHVMLPIAPYTETAGTFVNMEGRVQSFNACVKPQGDARPLWKVLRMLGSLLDLPGFDADTVEQVRARILGSPRQAGDPRGLAAWAKAGLSNGIAPLEWQVRAAPAALERIAEFPIYATDPIVRRSPPLQKTSDAKLSRTARFHPATFAALGLAEGMQVRIRQGEGEAILPALADPAVGEGCVRLARGIPETAGLGEGEVALDIVRMEAVA
jgi:NADH-quinone oxidoreductase subunit G